MTKTRAFITMTSAALTLAACAESPTAPAPGRLIALSSLTSVNGQPLPCCTADSAGAQVTIVAGALSFYRLAQYTDTVPTPAGKMSRACVQDVPDGASVDARTGLVTLPDGTTYLLLPCSVGDYTVTLRERIARGGAEDTTRVTVLISSGTYAWKRDGLSLTPDAGTRFTAIMSGATIVLLAGNRQYQFLAVPLWPPD
jgi:hypothetical protein